MTSPVAVTLKMMENRANVVAVYGRESLEKTVEALVLIAKKKSVDPFQFAVDESMRASRGGKEIVSLQLAAAACEIATCGKPTDAV